MTDGVVIVGGGLAGQRCAETLRRGGWDGPVRIVSAEPHPPYDRPPLSKELLAGDRGALELRLRPRAWYDEQGVDLLLGAGAERLDPATRTLELANHVRLRYDHLVIATGSEARPLPGLSDRPNAHALRTLDDALRLRQALVPGARLAIVGAGFIGLEVAATARRLGVHVTLLEVERVPLARIVGKDLGRWLAEVHAEEGVDVRLGVRVTGVEGAGAVTGLRLDGSDRVACDAVLVAIGAVPSTAWLAGSGLETDGVRVDSGGRTAAPGVLAVGDAASVLDQATGRHLRTEHWEEAAQQGARVARTILGTPSAASTPTSFWSDQYGTRIQLVGSAAGADAVDLDGRLADRDFAATFRRDGRPVGVLLAGRPRALPAARRLLADAVDPRPIDTRRAA